MALSLAAATALQTACTSTVTPDPVASHQASYDGEALNSGIIALLDAGFVVTPRFRDRYNTLAAVYGRAWSPAIGADYGVSDRGDGTFLFTREAMTKCLAMNAWRRMGREGVK